MHTHILGICGTFMGSVAVLAKQLGHKVTGSDQNAYPPMSTQLENQGIEILPHDSLEILDKKPDTIVVGNVMSRGMPVIEALIAKRFPLVSGPQWLWEHVLQSRCVLAVSGTHGKTTTTSMLAWILAYAGCQPGFLIGGVPENFGISATLGGGKFFVLEADEYDSAFFDKRSKFVHYWPNILILNNLEFDHGDIFNNLEEIQKQFHHLVRTVPESGCIIWNQNAQALKTVLEAGCWSQTQTFGADKSNWQIQQDNRVFFNGVFQGALEWDLLGAHTRDNALAAIAASRQVGVLPKTAIRALSEFKGVKRRMELKGIGRGVWVYDDFAHHPTAIETTLAGLKKKPDLGRIFAVVDIRSNTMAAGGHATALPACVKQADEVFFFSSERVGWDVQAMSQKVEKPSAVFHDLENLRHALLERVQPKDVILCMSNGAFGNLPEKLLQSLENSQCPL